MLQRQSRAPRQCPDFPRSHSSGHNVTGECMSNVYTEQSVVSSITAVAGVRGAIVKIRWAKVSPSLFLNNWAVFVSVKVCSDSRLEQRLGTERTEKTERTENSSHPGAGSEPQNTGRARGSDSGIGNIKIVWYLYKVWSLNRTKCKQRFFWVENKTE